jgi:site-specific recombinase XerD
MTQNNSNPSYSEIARIANNTSNIDLEEDIEPMLEQIFDSPLIRDFAMKMLVRWAETTSENRLGMLSDFESFLQGKSIAVEDFSGRDVRKYTDTLAHQGIVVGGINQYISTLQGLNSHLESEWGIEPAEITVEGKQYQGNVAEETQRKAIPKRDVRILIQGADGLRNTVIVAMFYYTGMRREELAMCDVTDVDREKREISVVGKGNKSRTVPYKSELEHILDRWIDVIRPTLPGSEGPALFLSTKGGKAAGRLSDEQMYAAVMKAADSTGLQEEIGKTCEGNSKYRIKPHVLRHSVATHMVEDGVPLRYIKRILGHESINTTLRYAKESDATVYDSYHKQFDGI